jgi:hypothetical protein
MKRLLPAVLFCVLLLPTRAAGDGCPPEECGVRALSVPGSPTVVLQPFDTVSGYDVASGERRFSAASGSRVSADGRSVIAADNPNGWTRIRRIDTDTGQLVVEQRLLGLFALTAVSADGRRVALKDAAPGRDSRLVVIDLATGRVQRVMLHGRFEPEAVSNDGKRLFVIEYIRQGYRVRLYDVARHALRPRELKPVNDDEPMRGNPVYAIGAPDGRWLLTLYVKPDAEAFIHALDLRQAKAYCIDLPGRGWRTMRYGLALGPDGRTLVAADPALGTLAQIDLGTVEVSRIVRFTRTDDTSQQTNAAFSPRGDLVYFAGLAALRAYDVRVGRVRGPYAIGQIGGFGFSPDGRRLRVIQPDARDPFWLDAATGRRI